VVVVGSHVTTTTRQLDHLLASDRSPVIHELAIEPLLRGGSVARTAIAEAAAALDAALAARRSGVVATERRRHDAGLEGGRAISTALVSIVESMASRPAWMVAKGGITSYDIASRALGMRDALVAGQLLPGVPVWIGADGSRWPRMPLVVFPGNVGADDALTAVVAALTGR
jgi:uncharacterized protein YgbK (DUF1537 family)